MRLYIWKLWGLLLLFMIGCWGSGFVYGQVMFSYPGGPFCAGSSVTISPSGATFSSSTAFNYQSQGGGTLDINGTSGEISLQNSTADTFTVVYFDSLNPTQPGIGQIIIFPQQSANFSYPNSGYCSDDLNPLPISGYTLGGQFSALTTGTAVAPITGEVDLRTSHSISQPNHQIQYTLGGACPDSFSISLEIRDSTAFFTLPGPANLCSSTNGQLVASNISGPGEFRILDGTNVVATANNTTGSGFQTSTNITNLSSLSPNTYYSAQFILNPGQVCGDTFSVPFTIGGTANFTANYPNSTICQTDTTLHAPINISNPCINCLNWYSTTGLNISSSGNIQTSQTPLGTHYVFVEVTNAACKDTFAVDTVIITAPGPSEIIYPQVVCKNGTQIPIPLNTPSPNLGTIQSIGALQTGPNYSLLLNSLPSQPGDRDFPIIYTPPQGSCAFPDTFVVTVREFSGVFGYPDTSLCKANIPQLPTGVITQGLGFNLEYIVDPNSPNPNQLSIDPISGEIDPQSSPVGTHLPALILDDNVCADTFQSSQFIEIFPNPDPDFSLPIEYCHNPGILIANPVVQGGKFSVQPSLGYLDLDSTGLINLNTSLSPGHFTITYSLENIGCPVDSSKGFNLHPLFYSSFNYLQDTFCSTQTENLYPILNTGGIGVSSFWCTTGLTVDPDSGKLELNSLGWHEIHYVVDSTYEPCPIEDSVLIYINPGNSDEFEYFNDAYCNSTPIAYVNTDSLASQNGTFFYNGALNLDLDSLTGQINLSNSDTGIFVVGYNLPGNQWCPDIQWGQIEIVPSNTTLDLSYPDSLPCQGEPEFRANLGPNPDYSGTFFSHDSIVWKDQRIGEIDMDITPAGTKVIGYALGGICKDTFLFPLTIEPYDSVWLEYDTTIYCNRDSLVPKSFGPIPGLFTESSGSVVFIDSLNGVIDLSQSNPNSLNPYSIEYTSNFRCPAKETFQLTILPTPQPIEETFTPAGDICEGDTLSITTLSNNIEILVNDSVVSSGERNFEYVCKEYENRFLLIREAESPCPQKDEKIVYSNPFPSANILEDSITLTTGSQVILNILGSIDSTLFNIAIQDSSPGMAKIDTNYAWWFVVPTPVEIPLQVYSSNDFVPGSSLIIVTPEAKACIGEPDSLYIRINPNTESIFIPEVFTPNGDDINDRWVISWNAEIDPLEYRIEVFNSAMGRVHTLPNLYQEWDGFGVPPGVYWWVLKDLKGKVTQSGGLTIRTN